MKKKGKVLIVDDDRFSRDLYGDILLGAGYQVEQASSAREAMTKMREMVFDVVVTDIVMPEVDGFDVIHFVNENCPMTDVLVTTGHADVEGAVRALKSGARDYLRKPVNAEEFRLVIARLLEQRNLFAENQEYRRYLSLFEACHRISGCLELERLLPLALHALGQEFDAQDGLVLAYDFSYALEEKTLQAIPLTVGSPVDIDQLVERYRPFLAGRHLMELQEMQFVEEPSYPEHAQRALILPVFVENEVKAVFLLFYDKETVPHALSQEAIKQRARFIGRQIELSLANALKFSRTREQVFVDDLTGLYNARYLAIALGRELKRSKRYNLNLSILFLDLDYFKNVNDQYGHLIGSRLLEEIAKVIRANLREIDTAIRYGGDEYAILLVNTDSGGATKVAERIRSAVERHALQMENGPSVKVTVCIGIASFPEHAQDVETLLDMADQAMYRGKKTTRNVVYIFNPKKV